MNSLQDEDDENPEMAAKLIVKPQSLVSVIRVDSYYNPNLIPQLQATIKMDQLKFSLVNQSQHLPSLATASNSIVSNQELAALTFNASVIGLDCWSNHGNVRINARTKSQVDLTFVDFMMLANHYVMLPCKVKAQAFVCLPKAGNGNGSAIQVDHHVRLQRLFLKGGHFFVDAVRNIQTLWDGNVGADDHLTAITIVNGTHNHLRLGQVLKPVLL